MAGSGAEPQPLANIVHFFHISYILKHRNSDSVSSTNELITSLTLSPPTADVD